MFFHSISSSSSLLTIYTATVSRPNNRTKGEQHYMYMIATTTFHKRQIIWTLLMSSSILCCISLTTIDNDRRFNKINIFCCRTSTNTVRYASSDNNSNNIDSIKEQPKFIYTSRKGDTAGHMVGSSIERPIRKNDRQVTIKTYKSFKNQWLEETGYSWPSKCCTNECSNEPTVGAHIFINKKEHAYLVPMCHRCNLNRYNFVPNEIIDNHMRFPIQLDDETKCVELTHLHASEQNTYANINNPTWRQMFERYIAYKKKHNSPLVPHGYKDDPRLGQWVSNQRHRYKGDGFNPCQIELLESNGFVWNALEYGWDENMKLLKKYKDREGHCNVPKDHREDGKNLGEWLRTQRKDKKKGTLDTVKGKQLEELGIVWDVFEHKWDEYIKLLIKYKDREGDCNVPRDHKEDGKNLGKWLNNQRHFKKRGTLDTVKEEQLEELGIVWAALEHGWDENIKLLMEYKDREGRCNVPRDHKEDDRNLGQWLSKQRKDKKKGILDTVKERQLEELGIVWDPFEYGWDIYIKLLMEYKDREGHCNVPYNHKEDGANLGKWVSKQKYKKLSEVRQVRLREIGVIWDYSRTGTK